MEHWNSETGKSGIILKREENEPKFTRRQFIQWPFSNETDSVLDCYQSKLKSNVKGTYG